jgi:two-component system OmpR family response regulator
MNTPLSFDPETIYVANETGWQQLKGNSTVLSATALRLLVLVDGKLSLGQIAKHLQGVAEANVGKIAAELVQKGFIRPVMFGEPSNAPDADVIDFFSDQTSDPTAASEQGGQDRARKLQEAQNFAAMLKQQGYAVRIARHGGATVKPASGAAYSVLVVEDNPTLSGVMRKTLELEGFVARVAANRDEVIAELRKLPSPDLILLDVGLPDTSGLDILNRVRSHPILKQIPIIMVTALTSREDVLNALAADANGYITKPFEFEALMNGIKAVLGLK